MSQIEEGAGGYVYILEVKDIHLPVCKIGMTARDPYERCDEINRSSTGDFIWAVAHYIAVDNCRKLESLVHSKLSPLRQRKREFFNINADDAATALNSIIDTQADIRKIDTKDISTMREQSTPTKKPTKGKRTFNRVDYEYAELFQLFLSLLDVKGRPFGQLNKPYFGISDGNKGVQWNLAVFKATGDIRLGVNLEGSEETGKWLIAPFVLSQPNIEEIQARVIDPQSIIIRFSRDAWQGASRLSIKEKYLGGREFSLSEMDQQLWLSILTEASTCLDESRNYRGRKRRQPVTMEADGRTVVKDISPHITIWSPLSLDGNLTENMTAKLAELRPVHEWIVKATQ